MSTNKRSASQLSGTFSKKTKKSAGSSETEEKSQDSKGDSILPQVFGKGVQSNQGAREEKRAAVLKRLKELESQEADFHTDVRLVDLICQLFSRPTLQGACKLLGMDTHGKKEILVASLLLNGWSVPTDQDAQEAYNAWVSGGEVKQIEQGKKGKPVSGGKQPEKKEKEIKKKIHEEVESDDFIGISALMDLKDSSSKDSDSSMPLSKYLKGYLKSQSELMATQAAGMKLLLDKKGEAIDDNDHLGSISNAATRAAKDGKYVNLLAVWDKEVAARRAEKVGRIHSVKQVKEMDWSDWTLAMLKLADLYRSSGQTNLAAQVLVLLTAAMTESATKSRQSVMAACEHYRKYETRSSAVWGPDPMGSQWCRPILCDIVLRGGYPKKKPTMGQQKNRFTTRKDEIPTQAERKPKFSLKQKKSCIHWLEGKICPFDPCIFPHSCIECGSRQGDIHDPTRCPKTKGKQRT